MDSRLEEKRLAHVRQKAGKNMDLWQVLDALAAQQQVEWRWVKGHSGDPGNERADALSNDGIPK